MLGGKLDRDKVVESRIDRTGTQTIGHGDQTKREHRVRPRESKQCSRRDQYAEGGHRPRTDLAGKAVGAQAGEDRAGGDDHRHQAGSRKRRVELKLHDRPGRAEERIRQPKADKR